MSYTHRRYQELDVGPHASGWVIHWEPGHDTGWHDHGGARVTLVIASGLLYEEYREMGQIEPQIRRSGPGDRVTLPAEFQHRVVPEVPCVAIHIYTPKLEVMNIFTDTGEWIRAQDAGEELQEYRTSYGHQAN